ncbi:MAG TPA: ribosome biogenesis GTP-binding protein YihA/YsxC [Gammaproteobacteria bacterium]|nr:ribosome biogenesis GTP-binding protein YihA/YsxC [Gammaproteobacteria bacterium]
MSPALFIKSASGPQGFPPDDAAEIAVVGRSNSGKSSAINAVTGVRKLARVSKTPGRTQLINFFELASGRRLVDLPGYGFARVAPEIKQRWRGLLEAYFNGRRGLKGVMITVDLRRGLMELDTAMIDWAAALDLPVSLLLTKADKLSRNAAAKQRRGVAGAAGPVESLIVFSALTGEGIEEARTQLDRWYSGNEA